MRVPTFVWALCFVVACSSTGGPSGPRSDGGGSPAQDGGSSGGADGGEEDAGLGTESLDGGSVATDGGGSVAADGGDAITHCTNATIAEPCATCSHTNCESQVANCFGQNWMSQDFSGGKCQALFECQCNCGNDGACLANCPPPDTACIQCLATARDCQTQHCSGLCQ